MRSVFFLVLLSLTFTASATAQPPVKTAPSNGYLIGPGDEVVGRVLGEKDFDFIARVSEEGTITVPFSDTPVVAKCKTDAQLRADVMALLTKWLNKPQLSLNITGRSIQMATVWGEVWKPSQYELRREATLYELIAYSGGPNDKAGGVVKVYRSRTPTCSDPAPAREEKGMFDPSSITGTPSMTFMMSQIASGKSEYNPIIYPGDVVEVTKAEPIYVTGEVLAAQGVYIKENGLTLMEAISMVGGLRRESKTKDIKIYRLRPDSKERDLILADLRKAPGTVLQANDIVEVGKAKENWTAALVKLAIGAASTAVTSGASSIGYRVIY